MPAFPATPRRAIVAAAIGFTASLMWPGPSAHAALGGCPSHGGATIFFAPSGPDGGYNVSVGVSTLSNCRAEAEIEIAPQPFGDTPAFVAADSRSGEVEVVSGGLARLGDPVVVTFHIQSYDLGGDASNVTLSCSTYVGSSCSV